MPNPRAKTAKITNKPLKVLKAYPFATTPVGKSFVEDDLKQWARLRVYASRYNKKNNTNFVVKKEIVNGKQVLRCGIPE